MWVWTSVFLWWTVQGERWLLSTIGGIELWRSVRTPLSTVQKPFYEKLLIFMLTLKLYFSGVYKYYSDHGLLKNSTTSHNSFHFLRVSLQLQLLDSVDLRRKEGSVEGAVVWGVGGEGGGLWGRGDFPVSVCEDFLTSRKYLFCGNLKEKHGCSRPAGPRRTSRERMWAIETWMQFVLTGCRNKHGRAAEARQLHMCSLRRSIVGS